ncbi:ABC transporter ATP-binding protein [Pseudoroseicyclus sp. H15]
MMEPVLDIDDLSLEYTGGVQALREVCLSVRPGEVLGIAGESGCGKSTLASAMISLLGAGATITGGVVRLKGEAMSEMPERKRRALRGREIAMVFQDPITAFNPVLRIGEQLIDFQINAGCSRGEKRRRAKDMLAKVGLEPDLAMSRFPHELSGGMRQRAAIAAALLMRPAVLIADEPTTALDVTMEAQIIHLLRELQAEVGCAIVIVTHHLGVIAELCDRVAVMYAGQVVEVAPVDDLYHAPLHPYTQALLSCDPSIIEKGTGRLPTIGGRLPDLAAPPAGCAFAPRCPQASDICQGPPPRRRPSSGREALCHKVAP